jgi:thiamine-monophosphate kinase
MPGDEFARIARIAQILGPPGDPRLIPIGIGDDAAVIDPAALAPGERLVWTIDAVVEGVHFRREWLSFEDLGFRATVAATSDVLAMGARPLAAIVGWTLPADIDDLATEAIARGQRAAAELEGMSVVGGNLSSGPLSLTTAVLGATTAPIGRRGARAGDRLVVVGTLGEAALGRLCLERAETAGEAVSLVAAFRRPQILRKEALTLAAMAHAMIDVSDGLCQDAGHLAEAGAVRAVIEAGRLASRRSPRAIAMGMRLHVDVEALELGGGDDYALVAAVAKETALPPGFSEIGRFEAGEGVVVVDVEGRERAAPIGYRHQ